MPRQEDDSFEKISLADGRTAYLLLRFTGSSPSLGFEPASISCFAGVEADIDNSQEELEQPNRDKSKDQGKEMIEINLVAQREET